LFAVALIAAVVGVAGVVAAVNEGGRSTVTADDPSALPLTLEGHRDWFLAFLTGYEPDSAEYEARLAPNFVDAVSFERFMELKRTLPAQGAVRILREVERRGETVLAVQLVSATDDQIRLSMRLADDGRVNAAVILTTVPCADPVLADGGELAPPLRAALDWLIDVANSERELPDEELERMFTPEFLAAVPPEQFRQLTEQLRGIGPLSPRHFEGQPTATSLHLRVGVNTGEEARVAVTIEATEPHRISGATVLTQQPCRLPRT
jgi:hypothetical protein